jgi:hypothetical protein
MKSSFNESSELDGYDDLKDEDKAKVDAAWEAGHVAEEDIPATAKKPSAGDDEDEDEEKPKKKKAAPRAKKAKDADEEAEEKPKKARVTKAKAKVRYISNSSHRQISNLALES